MFTEYLRTVNPLALTITSLLLFIGLFAQWIYRIYRHPAAFFQQTAALPLASDTAPLTDLPVTVKAAPSTLNPSSLERHIP